MIDVSMDNHSKKQRSGFTLIELLVVIAVVAVLIGLRIPALAKAHTQSYRFACLANCKLMAQGSALFSNDDSERAFTGTINYADDDLNWLFPNYIPDINVFHCPAAQQIPTNDSVIIIPTSISAYDAAGGFGLHLSGVQASGGFNQTDVRLYADRLHGKKNMVKSLDENAHGKLESYGSSYEVSGFLNSDTRKTEANLAGYKYTGKDVLNNINLVGQTASVSDIWITYDEDDAVNSSQSGSPYTLYDDYPEQGDNHGTAGGNVSFADGHAAWVKRSDYLLSHAKGTDTPYNVAAPP